MIPIAPVPWFIAISVLLYGLGIAFATLHPRWIVDHPRSVLSVLGLITIGATAALIQPAPLALSIGVDSSTEPLLPRNDPGRPIYDQAVLDFGTDDVYVIAIESDGVFTTEVLGALRRASEEILGLPGVRGVESLSDVHTFRIHDDLLEVGPFIDDIPTDPDELATLKREALSDPVYTKTLVSANARTAAINVTFMPMSDGEFVDRDLDGQIRSIVEHEISDEMRFYVTGRPHIRSEAHHLLVRDMLRLIPIAIAVATVLLFVMSGSIRGTLVPLISNVSSTYWAFGAMAQTGTNLTLITLVLGPMLICVGAVYGVHVMARYELIAVRASDPRSAALETLEYARTPVLIAGLTTCVGFAALLVANIPATTELGAFAMFGIASVTLLSVSGVPAALALLPLRGRDGELRVGSRNRVSSAIGRGFEALLRRGARLVVGRSGDVIAVWSVAALASLALIPQIVIDTDFIKYFLEDSRVRQHFSRVNELLVGAVPIYVPVHGNAPGFFREPESLRRLEDLQHRLENTEGVSRVLSAVDLIRVANRALSDDDPAEERIPDSRGLVAEAIFTIPKNTLRPFANSNHSRANLIVRTSSLGSHAVRGLEERIRAAIDSAALPASMQADVTGNTILINRSSDGIAGNQTLQVSLAAATILVLIVVVFRSAKLGLLGMVPNIVPVLLFFGALGLGVATLSVPTSLIGCIALGIAVDDTVHFLVGYRHARDKGMDSDDAARHTMVEVGRPMLITSVMLILGFGVITLSGFATLREFGYLTGVTMAICIGTDLCLLPALVARLKI